MNPFRKIYVAFYQWRAVQRIKKLEKKQKKFFEDYEQAKNRIDSLLERENLET